MLRRTKTGLSYLICGNDDLSKINTIEIEIGYLEDKDKKAYIRINELWAAVQEVVNEINRA